MQEYRPTCSEYSLFRGSFGHFNTHKNDLRLCLFCRVFMRRARREYEAAKCGCFAFSGYYSASVCDFRWLAGELPCLGGERSADIGEMQCYGFVMRSRERSGDPVSFDFRINERACLWAFSFSKWNFFENNGQVRLEAGGWKLEVGRWKLEVGCWKLLRMAGRDAPMT